MTTNPEADRRHSLRGIDADRLASAVAHADPLPGGRGFAGWVDSLDGVAGPVLVRDVLGREPVFVEASAPDPTIDGAWSFDRRSLSDPEPVPAGRLVSSDECRVVWELPTPQPWVPKRAQAAVDRAVRSAVEGIGSAAGKSVPTAAGSEPTVDGIESTVDGSDRTRTDGDSNATGRTAVAFSGGVDSALVASGVPDAPCYVAGFEGCHDIAAARTAADRMDRDLRVVEITHDDITRTIPTLVDVTGRTNAMDLTIVLPLYLTGKAAAADGHNRLLLGQGADELFGGYSKVVDPENDHRVQATTVRGARDETIRTLPGQLERDVSAVRAAGVEPVTPLLEDQVVAAALRLPAALLATDDRRKIALRNAAKGLVSDPIRSADKKAVQYGSYVSRELDRLARQAGFKRRMDDHVGQYVESLVEDL